MVLNIHTTRLASKTDLSDKRFSTFEPSGLLVWCPSRCWASFWMRPSWAASNFSDETSSTTSGLKRQQQLWRQRGDFDHAGTWDRDGTAARPVLHLAPETLPPASEVIFSARNKNIFECRNSGCKVDHINASSKWRMQNLDFLDLPGNLYCFHTPSRCSRPAAAYMARHDMVVQHQHTWGNPRHRSRQKSWRPNHRFPSEYYPLTIRPTCEQFVTLCDIRWHFPIERGNVKVLKSQ